MGYTPLLVRKAVSAYRKEFESEFIRALNGETCDYDNDEQQMLKIIKRDGIFSVLNSNGEFDNHPKRETIKLLFETCHEWMNGYSWEILYFNRDADSTAVQEVQKAERQTLLFQTKYNDLGRRYGIVISDVGIYQYEYQRGLFRYDSITNEINYFSTNHFDSENECILCYNEEGKEVACVECYGVKAYELANVLNQVCQLPENRHPYDLLAENDIEGAKKAAEAVVWVYPKESFSHMIKSCVLKQELEILSKDYKDIKSERVINQMNEVEKELKLAVNLADLNDEVDKRNVSICQIQLSDIEFKFNNLESARKHLIQGLERYTEDDKDFWIERLDVIDAMMQSDWDDFTTKKYNDRKFIMPIKNIVGVNLDNITVFRMSNIPGCIEFPFGHPTANQLYIAHPFKTSLYVPYEKSEELFFSDKFYELKYLLECLGAEEITITSIKGKDVSELKDNNNNTSVGVDKKAFSANVDVNTHNETKSRTIQNSQHSLTVRLSSMHKPFVPEGLLWYKEMPQWQRLVQSRLNNNLLEYSELISTEETKFTSFTEMSEVQIEAKMLWSKVNVEVDSCMKNQFKESTETEWRVDVRFRPLQEFESEETETVADNGQSGLTEEEMKYAEEVMFFLEDDGIIDTDERRHLERKRIKLGISEEQAAKIEASMSLSALSEDEQEYYDAVKEELMDGVIPDSSRRLLERFRTRMGISAERAREIEMMLTK